MKNFYRKTLIAAFLIGSAVTAFSQQMPPIPTDPDVRTGKLENGLTYYIRHNELPEKQADFYIAQKVGSILEEDNQRGLAHFLEHMCFNGTKNFPGNSLREYLESIGVKFGVNLNAYTSIDETVYNINDVPVIREGIIDSCLLILHDWADDLTLDPKEIDKERGVIHEEWRTRTGAMMRMYETAFPTIFAGSKYAYRLPIGTMEVVDNFPYQALRDYYEKWYRPDQQGIIVVGDVNVDQIEQKIKNLFGPIQMPANPAERVHYPVPDNKETIVSINKDKEQEINQVMVFHKHEPFPAEMKNTVGYLAYSFMDYAISHMLNARLQELLLTATPPFINAGAQDMDFILAKTKRAFTGVAICKEDGIESGLKALMREIERAHRFGFTASEYARAKADYLSNLENVYNERDKMKNNQFVAQYVSNFIDGEPIPSVEYKYTMMNQLVPNIPLESVNQLYQQQVSDTNRVVCLFCPDKEGMKYPTEESIRKVLAEVNAEKLEPYVDKTSDEPLMKEKPTGGKVTNTEKGPFESTILTLSNGVRVVLKPTNFKADEIRMQSFSAGGNSLFDDEDALQYAVLDEVVSLGGLGNFSAIDLQKILAGKVASASASVRTLTEAVNGSCAPKDLETMLQLTYLSFTAPRTDQAAFESFKNRLKAQLANQEANPNTALSDTITKVLYGDNPRAARIKADKVDQIDYGKIMEMYRDRFKDASDFTFIFVGNIDPATATPLIETYLGGLPSTGRKENFRDPKLDIRKGEWKNIFHKDLQTQKATVIIVESGTCEYTLKNKLMMSMLSQLLTMKYTETVREEAGASYGVSVQGNLSKYPKEEATLQIFFDTDPTKRADMSQLIDKGIEEFIAGGPKAEDLAKVKEYMLKTYEANQKENGYWMSLLYGSLWEGMDGRTGYTDLVNGITNADLQQFAKTLMAQKNRIEVSMTSGDTN